MINLYFSNVLLCLSGQNMATYTPDANSPQFYESNNSIFGSYKIYKLEKCITIYQFILKLLSQLLKYINYKISVTMVQFRLELTQFKLSFHQFQEHYTNLLSLVTTTTKFHLIDSANLANISSITLIQEKNEPIY